jgi:predicted metal-dependent hydrolase
MRCVAHHDPPGLAEGLALLRAGDGFAAHEAFEAAWRTAAAPERDFYQGLVHVAVAPYQEARGNPVGRARQLEKARRRLAPYAPAHRGVDVGALLAWCERSLAGEPCGIPPVADGDCAQ